MFVRILQWLAPEPGGRTPRRLAVEALEDRVVPAPILVPEFDGHRPAAFLLFRAAPRLWELNAQTGAGDSAGAPSGPFVGFGPLSPDAPLPAPELLAQLRQIADRRRLGGFPRVSVPLPEGDAREPSVFPHSPQVSAEAADVAVEPVGPPSPPIVAPLAINPVNQRGGLLSGSDSPFADGAGAAAELTVPESRPEPVPARSDDTPAAARPVTTVEPDADIWDFAPIRELARDAWAQVKAELPDLNLSEDVGEVDPALWQVGVCLLTAATVWAVAPRRERASGDAPESAERSERNANP